MSENLRCPACGMFDGDHAYGCAHVSTEPTPPASHDAGEEFAKLRGSERHANYAETRYWCEQYRLFGSKAVDTIATLTAELAEARAQRDSLRDECERLRGIAFKLAGYGGHTDYCSVCIAPVCNCGFSDLLRQLAPAALSASGREVNDAPAE